ncbi:hypothetical protein L9G15_11960 [Shewanella sp. A3A]|uniref:Uncharacterized protein n=1 Tax=Shewanella electrica TaxID=515560 RepID=A0ABT2FSY4_9GAMM|nr:hypothetical protein [Shewanella electrica]MCH1920145.1 hypothetical protein [Shewanella ferrihydritica]MCH1926773.1 hypothetical protein [Shewanella electrica]MCS4558334.1 hypothetical protein [Shewanella electrica]
MKALLGLALLVASGVVSADDELPAASAADVKQLVQVCRQMAIEDEITKDELDEYLLDCVNDQLNEMGYRAVDALPKS